jgi:hypothetical protein
MESEIMEIIDKEVGATILRQLGGNRFAVMTGASKFIALKNGLQFFIPRSKNIRRVQILLTGDDLYTMAFYSIYGTSIKLINSKHAVGCNQLQSIFEKVTGLHTHL